MLPLCHVQGTDGERAFLPFTFFATTAATTMVKNVPRSTAKRACQTLNQEIDFVQERFWKFMVKEFSGVYGTCRKIHGYISRAFLPFTFFATTGATTIVKNVPAFNCQKTLNQDIDFVQESFWKFMAKEFWELDLLHGCGVKTFYEKYSHYLSQIPKSEWLPHSKTIMW